MILKESKSESVHVHDRSGSGIETCFFGCPAGRDSNEVFYLALFVLISVSLAVDLM